ncbi:MAG: hypothetical protein ABL955_02325 [Elusimicrobiota bacterium]
MSLKALLLMCLVLPVHAAEPPAPPAPRRVEVLLNAQMAKLAKLGPLNAGFVVTPTRVVLLSSDTEMFTVGWGGIQPISGIVGMEMYAFAHDGNLLGIRKQELVYLDDAGALAKLFTLPSLGMGIVRGVSKQMFLFERVAGGKSGLYELLPGRKIVKILESPGPIRAVTQAADGRILFAVGGAIFEVAPGNKMRTVAVGGKPIRSLATNGSRIYASDGASVYSIEGDKLTLITKETSGDIQWFDGGLLIFDPKSPLLVRITGL